MTKIKDPTVTRCITLVRFKRTKNAQWEHGVGIGNDANDKDVIIDLNNKVVGRLYDFRPEILDVRMDPDGIWFEATPPYCKIQ